MGTTLNAARLRRMTAVLMTVCMTVTMLPGYSLAKVQESDRTMVITSFEPLKDSVAQQSVPAGTGESELELPDELEAMGYAKQVEGTDTATASNSVPDPDEELIDDTPRPVRITGVRWEPEPVYDPDIQDTYCFTAVLPDRYESEGAELPRILVTVDGEVKRELLKSGKALPEVDVRGGVFYEIYANGTPLLIDGPDENHTTIYIDANGNGERDEGELSLKEAGIEGAPEDNANIGGYTVYGGCKNGETASTRITMAGGYVMGIYGGGFAEDGSTTVSGDTHVTVTGGTTMSVTGGGCVWVSEGKKALVGGNTWVEIKGGEVGSVSGGGGVLAAGTSEVVKTAHVTVSEDAVIWGGVNGGGSADSTVKDTDVTITGGQMESVYGGAGEVTGTVTVTVTGGTMGELYAVKSSQETKPAEIAVNIGGSAAIGDRQTKGIRLDASGAYGVDRFAITDPLTGEDESVTVQLSGAYGDGSVIVTNASETDLKRFKFAGAGLAGKTAYFDSGDNTIKLKMMTPSAAPAVDSGEEAVYANGNLLLITGADSSHTTIYVDANGNGQKDDGEQSLKELGIENAPEDGADLRSYKVYGGSRDGEVPFASITMTGGGVYGIYGGGCMETAAVNGDVYVTVSGGEVQYLYGNLENRKVTGKILVAVIGGRVTKTVYGQHNFGRMEESLRPADVTVRIGGAVKIGDLSSPEDSYGIVISPQKGRSGVDHFNIDTLLTEDVVVYLDKDGEESYGDRSVISTCTSWEDVDRIKLTGAGAGRLRAEHYGDTIVLEKLSDPEVDPDNKVIYANGNSLFISGDSETSTTVYMDINNAGGNGGGEQSLQAAGIPNAPEDGADLSQYTIYGGSKDRTSDSTRVTMTGGSVAAIYGGGHVSERSAPVTNDTIVTVSGGTVGAVYGGSKIDQGARGGSQVWGTSYVTVSGDAVVTSVYGSGSAGLSVTVNTDVVISGGRIGSVYGSVEGSNVSDTISVRITGGTVGSVYGHGLDTEYAHRHTRISVGGDAKVGDGQTKGIMLDASGQYGADRVNIEAPLTGGKDAVTVLLSGDYEGGSVIATGVSQSDLAGLKLAGDGMADMKKSLEGAELKLFPVAAYIGSQGYVTLEQAFAAADSVDPQNPTVIELVRNLEWGKGKDIPWIVVVPYGKSVKLTSRGETAFTISTNTSEREAMIFDVQNGSTLILENLVIDGRRVPVQYSNPVISVSGAKLILEHGAVIKDHGGIGIGVSTSHEFVNQGVSEVIMSGGEISGNAKAGISLSPLLADVAEPKNRTMRFIMNDGEIKNNRSKSYGAGVSGLMVESESTVEIIIHGGSITGNICENGAGGGIFCVGRFIMDGGTISGNSAGMGGGVYLAAIEAKITGGSISGNTATVRAEDGEEIKRGEGANLYLLGVEPIIFRPQENMDGIFLEGSTGFLVEGPLEHKVTLEGAQDPNAEGDGHLVAQGMSQYTLTEADAAKFSCENADQVLEMNADQLKLFNASYEVSYRLTGVKGAEALPESAKRRNEFRVKLIAEDGYLLPASDVSVRVGADELTEGQDYQLENTAESCIISIPAEKLTGNVEIAAKATPIITVSRAEVTGITAPSAGKTPDTTAADGTGFTAGAVTWRPAVTRFDYSAKYTADITLTAKTGYQFAKADALSATVNGMAATVTRNSDTSITVSCQFPRTESDNDSDEVVSSGGTVSTGVQVQTPAPSVTTTETGTTVAVKVDPGMVDASVQVARSQGADGKQVPVEIRLPAEALAAQLNNPDGRPLAVEVEIPTSVSGSAATSIAAVNLPKEVMQAAKNTGKDMTVTIKDEHGNVSIQWTFAGKDLKQSAQAVTDVNLAVSVSPVKTLTGDKESIKAVVAGVTGGPAAEVLGLSIGFGHSGPLPATARVRIPAGNDAGIQPGGAVNLYYYNTVSGSLELQPGSPFAVDQSGYVDISLGYCADYVLVPVKTF